MYAPNEGVDFLLINLVVIKNMLIMNLYIFFILTERHKDTQREEIFLKINQDLELKFILVQ